jgi:hypothetical protein
VGIVLNIHIIRGRSDHKVNTILFHSLGGQNIVVDEGEILILKINSR